MSWEADLHALRSGALKFDSFARAHHERFERWARSLMGARARLLVSLSRDDVVQVMMLTAWRAVDAWDPARRSRKGEPVELRRYVDWQIGKAVQVEMARELGWSRKGVLTRRAPVRVEDLGALIDRRASVAPTAERLSDARRRAASLGGLDGDVASGIVSGLSLEQIATRVYADRPRKFAYRLDSPSDASAKVGKACRRALVALDN